MSIYYLGTLIGCMVGGWIGDKIGRKKTILVGCAWIFLGAPLQVKVFDNLDEMSLSFGLSTGLCAEPCLDVMRPLHQRNWNRPFEFCRTCMVSRSFGSYSSRFVFPCSLMEMTLTGTLLALGFWLSLDFTLNILGVVVAYWFEYGLSFVGNGDTQIRWRFPVAFQLM